MKQFLNLTDTLYMKDNKKNMEENEEEAEKEEEEE